jgi:hypothetical protein
MANRTPVNQWGELFNFSGKGILHMEIFLEFGGAMAGQTLLEWIAAQLLQRGTAAARPSAATVPEGAEYYASDTNIRYKAVAGAWVNDGTPASDILHTRVVLTDAQIKTLPTASVVLVAAPGAAKRIAPVLVALWKNFTAGAYTGHEDFSYITFAFDSAGLNYDNGQYIARDDANTYDALQAFLDANQAHLALFPGGAYCAPGVLPNWSLPARNQYLGSAYNFPNCPLVLYAYQNSSSNFGGGNAANTLAVDTYYSIIDA